MQARIINTSEVMRILANYENQLQEYNFNYVQITSYASLRTALEMHELSRVVSELQGWAKHFLHDYEFTFMNYTRSRENATNHITYENNFNTPTNRLHFELMQALFNPSNLAILLRHLMPSLNESVVLVESRIPEEFPEGLSKLEKISFFRNSSPEIVLVPHLGGLTHLPPTLEALSSLVIEGRTIFDLSTVKHYSFNRHCKLYDALHQTVPALARKLYQHNHHWQTLANNILMAKRAGLTPKEAIEQLIAGLKLGGESATGSATNASEPAMVAVSRFIDYFEDLPDDLQKTLNAMTDNRGVATLPYFFEQLEKIMCVEILAKALTQFISDNKDAKALNEVAGIAEVRLKQLEKQCRAGLDTRQDSLRLSNIPARLAKLVVRSLNITDLDDQWVEFARLPDELYPSFFAFATLSDLESSLKALNRALKNGYLNHDKAVAIIVALLKCPNIDFENCCVLSFTKDLFAYHLYRNTSLSIQVCDQLPAIVLYRLLTQMVKVGQAKVPLLLALPTSSCDRYIHYMSDALLKALMLIEVDGAPLYFYLAIKYSPVFLKVMNRLPQDDRASILAVRRKPTDETFIMLMISNNISGFNAIKTWYSPESFADEVRKADVKGNTVFHYAAKDVSTLLAYLRCLPEADRKAALFKWNKDQQSPFGLILKTKNVIRVIREMQLMPPEKSDSFVNSDLLDTLRMYEDHLSYRDQRQLIGFMVADLMTNVNAVLQQKMADLNIRFVDLACVTETLALIPDGYVSLKIFIASICNANDFCELECAIEAFEQNDDQGLAEVIVGKRDLPEQSRLTMRQ